MRILVATTRAGPGGVLAKSLADDVATIGERPEGSDLPHVRTDFGSRAAADVAIDEATAILGGLDALVYAAALPDVPHIAPLESWSTDAWIEASELPVLRAMFAMQAAYRVMAASGGGRIVLVQPTVGVAGRTGTAAISAAVEGQRILAKVAARQWGGAGVSVNAVLVGLDVAAPVLGDGVSLAAAIAEAGTGYVPPALRPVGNSEPGRHLAPLVAFFASPQGGLVTGQTVIADGGAWMLP
jgi:3-oxoacyl-[acyl-carrier protein] reductase